MSTSVTKTGKMYVHGRENKGRVMKGQPKHWSSAESMQLKQGGYGPLEDLEKRLAAIVPHVEIPR